MSRAKKQVDLATLEEWMRLRPIEDIIKDINIDDIEDFTIRIIFRTLSYSIDRLREELNLFHQDHR